MCNPLPRICSHPFFKNLPPSALDYFQCFVNVHLTTWKHTKLHVGRLPHHPYLLLVIGFMLRFFLNLKYDRFVPSVLYLLTRIAVAMQALYLIVSFVYLVIGKSIVPSWKESLRNISAWLMSAKGGVISALKEAERNTIFQYLFPVGAGNESQMIPERRWQGPYPVTHSFFRSPWQRHKLGPVSEKHINRITFPQD